MGSDTSRVTSGTGLPLAAEAARSGRGCVGSTSNILHFIRDRLAEQLSAAGSARLQFVLGTEAGMITAIVDRVQALLAESGRHDVEVEIITANLGIRDDPWHNSSGSDPWGPGRSPLPLKSQA